MNTNKEIITAAYIEFKDMLRHYVSKRISGSEETMDIVQDVFVRLLTYEFISKESIKNLCFTIANNIVIDHIRHHYKRNEVYDETRRNMKNMQSLTPEQIASFHDLAEKEHGLMIHLSPATALVYELSQIKGMSIDEIACELHISRRTVECHQFKGRKIIREKLRAII